MRERKINVRELNIDFFTHFFKIKNKYDKNKYSEE